MESNDGLLWKRWWTFVFIKIGNTIRCVNIRSRGTLLNLGCFLTSVAGLQIALHRGPVFCCHPSSSLLFLLSALYNRQIYLGACLDENWMFVYVNYTRQVCSYVKHVFMQPLMGLRGLNTQTNRCFFFLNQFLLASFLFQGFKIRDGQEGKGR
jgi:hypothetical protein